MYQSRIMNYQGKHRKNNYFEGWYFKQVSSDLKNSISIIPGISKAKDDSHTFIQTILLTNDNNITNLKTHYHRFSIDDFIYKDVPFCLMIGKNKFSTNAITLDLTDDEYSIKGEIFLSKFLEIERSLLMPNIMGYFSYIPFMECYHGIVSMGHELKGSLDLNHKSISFEGGKGYIEKDWGTSFPREYIWLQSNCFNTSQVSLMASIADIPFMGATFQGFICNLVIEEKEYRFATYNNSKIIELKYTDTSVEVTVKKGKLILEMSARMFQAGNLKAPKLGVMKNVIKEGMSGVVNIQLSEKGKLIYEGEGTCCGIEIVKGAVD